MFDAGDVEVVGVEGVAAADDGLTRELDAAADLIGESDEVVVATKGAETAVVGVVLEPPLPIRGAFNSFKTEVGSWICAGDGAVGTEDWGTGGGCWVGSIDGMSNG